MDPVEKYLEATRGSAASSHSRSADTRVFWDIEDFPVPPGRTINSLRIKIERSLYIEDFRGDLSFWVYSGKKSQHTLNHFRALDFVLGEESDDKPERLNTMLLDMVYWAYLNPLARLEKRLLNLMVIAKDLPKEEGETKLAATLAELEKRGYNVLLVVPDDTITVAQAPFPDAAIVWHWTKLFDGKEASFPEDSDSDCEEESAHREKRLKISDADCGEESSRLVGGNLNVVF